MTNSPSDSTVKDEAAAAIKEAAKEAKDRAKNKFDVKAIRTWRRTSSNTVKR